MSTVNVLPELKATKQKTPRNHSKQLDWEKLVSEWEASGLSQTEFCQPLGITHQMFAQNRKNLMKQKSSRGKFISVKMGDMASLQRVSENNFVLDFPNGIKLRIPPLADGDTLKTILLCLEK